MMVYKKSHSQPFKWLLAFVVFILVMSITFSDVYGIQVNTSQDNSAEAASTSNEVSFEDVQSTQESSTPPDEGPGSSTVPVPEPMTLILVAGGLTAIYAARRLRQKA